MKNEEEKENGKKVKKKSSKKNEKEIPYKKEHYDKLEQTDESKKITIVK